jgi:hypothetical protein
MDRNYWGYPPSKPIPVEDGIKARTKRGQFGEHWWSQCWSPSAIERAWGAGARTSARGR